MSKPLIDLLFTHTGKWALVVKCIMFWCYVKHSNFITSIYTHVFFMLKAKYDKINIFFYISFACTLHTYLQHAL